MVSMQTAHYSLAYYSILLFSHHFGIKRFELLVLAYVRVPINSKRD